MYKCMNTNWKELKDTLLDLYRKYYGHDKKSVILLLKHIDLTDEEMLCIRWHDARFNNNEVERIAIESVLHKYKLALKLMQADQEAAYWFNE